LILKEIIKKILKKLPLRITKNQQYDYYTKKIIAKVCNSNSNCIDIGCHKGEILDIIIKSAPSGNHFCFEPIPELYTNLMSKYKSNNLHFYKLALSNIKGNATFNHVLSNPAYSGLLKRTYDKKNEIDTEIEVETNLLDNIIPQQTKIDFIKIDVEGGELQVLEGAFNLLKNNKPIVLFEHGLGASDMYGSYPDKVFELFEQCDMKISLLVDFLKMDNSLNKKEFELQFYNRENYYFVAHPK
jgi:FkbM family methyltransferase